MRNKKRRMTYGIRIGMPGSSGVKIEPLRLLRFGLPILIVLHCLLVEARMGIASTPTASVVPISMDFNSQTMGTQSRAQTVTVSNIGDATLTISNVNIPSQFVLTSGPANPVSLAPGRTATFTVAFVPGAAQTFSGQLTFSTDSSPPAPVVLLSGTGSPSASVANVTPTSVAFGNESAGVLTCKQIVAISNGGASPFTVTAVTTAAPFAVDGFSGPTVLASGKHLDLGITFHPTAQGAFNDDLSVSFDVLPAVTVPLSGVGVEAAAPGSIPLIDMGQLQTYLGFPGGLFEHGCNVPPSYHDEVGRSRAALVTPLDVNGNPSSAGKIVLLSIGMCNASMEFCGEAFGPPIAGCSNPRYNSLIEQAAADPNVNHQTLLVLNGAEGGQSASKWASPTDSDYDLVKTAVLEPAGVTEAQVQAVWLKNADGGPTVSLPSPDADAYKLETYLGDTMRAMKVRYPNLRLVFLSSRIYAGYATSILNPEPYAYESGLAVKWLVQAQIEQMGHGGVIQDPNAGDLNYKTVAPWITWGPYPWANGSNPRSDGLSWLRTDLGSDGTHPSQYGIQKVGSLLLNYFLSSPYTGWFLAAGP